MSRRSAAVAGLAVLIALWIATGLLPGGGRGASLSAAGIPLFRVERRPYTRTVTAEGFLRAVRATPISIPADLPGFQRIVWIAPEGEPVRKGDVILRFDSGQAERALVDGKDDLDVAGLKIRQTEEEKRTERENLLLDAELAERELEQVTEFGARDAAVYSRHEVIDSEIDEELARGEAANARRRSERVLEEARTQLELLAIEKAEAESKLRRARQGLATLEVRAPHDGLFVTRDWDSGNKVVPGIDVWPGWPVGEIPDPERMQAKVYVLEADASGLRAGCRATLVVEAHSGREYRARVERVEALAKRRDWRSPVQYFEAILAPDETDIGTMKPGQSVRAEIVLEEVPAALAVPPQAIRREAGRTLAFRREGPRLVPVEVRLGPASPCGVVVEQGLKEGDEIALRDPRRRRGEREEGKGAGEAGPPTPRRGEP